MYLICPAGEQIDAQVCAAYQFLPRKLKRKFIEEFDSPDVFFETRWDAGLCSDLRFHRAAEWVTGETQGDVKFATDGRVWVGCRFNWEASFTLGDTRVKLCFSDTELRGLVREEEVDACAQLRDVHDAESVLRASGFAPISDWMGDGQIRFAQVMRGRN